jgi:hypothetical protein
VESPVAELHETKLETKHVGLCRFLCGGSFSARHFRSTALFNMPLFATITSALNVSDASFEVASAAAASESIMVHQTKVRSPQQAAIRALKKVATHKPPTAQPGWYVHDTSVH